MPLTLHPKHWFSWDFTVDDGQRAVADIDVSWWRERGTLSVAGRTYPVYREGLMSGDFILESDGVVLARAAKPSAFRRAFELNHDGRTYILRARSAFRRAFVLEHGSREVGSVVPQGLMRRWATAELPDTLPLPVKVFALWLTILIWKRESDSAAAAG
jgi:hypothetical protein